MKRVENVAIVVGRNRRVYARVYKMINRIDDFSEHYYKTEIEKSREEGFRPVGMVLEKPNETTWIFRVNYEPIDMSK